MSQHFGHTEVKATRKPHHCSWCNELIDVGSRAFKAAWMFEGDFNYGYEHPECKEALQKSNHPWMSDGWELGSMERGVAWMKGEESESW